MQTEELHLEAAARGQAEAREYLVNLKELASELDRAMGAIVKRELPSLQNSLHLQQDLCARLAHLGQRSDVRLERSKSEKGPIDSDLATEIKAASETLLVLNRRYAALLEHSGETLRLFAGLFRSYHGSAQSASGIQASLQTWSCEV